MISISPGHWKPGTGAKDIVDEVTEARRITRRVVEILRKGGIQTNHIEDNFSNNKNQNLTYLVTQHNKTTRELDVSIHLNASSGRQVKGIGTEVLYIEPEDKILASNVSSAISKSSGLINRGAKNRNDLAFLNNIKKLNNNRKKGTPKKKAILIEVFFVNSTVDVALYNRDFEKICQAIAKELATAVGKTLGGNVVGKYELVEDKNSKVWRIQSGAYKDKKEAIKAFEKSGFKYATIKGSEK